VESIISIYRSAMRLHRKIFCIWACLLWLATLQLTAAWAQTPRKAIVVAWDGVVPSFVHEMLLQGKLPNLAKLIENGAFADAVVPVFPSFTAPGFASLWSGAPPRITGVSGNRVPRVPRGQYSILETSAGLNSNFSRADLLWAAAERAGRKIVVTHVPFGGIRSERGVHIQGYPAIAGRDGIIRGRNSRPLSAGSWVALPASVAPPLEIAFTIGASNLFGLLIDDPSDSQEGYDTLLVSGGRAIGEIKAKLKAATAGPGGELFWSQPLDIKTGSGEPATTYLRLFELKLDGSDFLLYFSRPVRKSFSNPELPPEANDIVRAFVGNGANLLYGQGAFGLTIPNGGDGTAEACYLETIRLVQRQLIETNRWALKHYQWDFFLAYTPFPDEAEHAWRGYLEASLDGFRQQVASRLRPFLEQVYRTSDELLGLFMEQRSENTIIALVSDHGMEGTHKLVAVNTVLQRSGLLVWDDRGRLDLARTKILYPNVNHGYLLINSNDRKHGIVGPEERNDLVKQVREALLQVRDGDRQVVTSVYDAETEGVPMGIGGDTGGDIYLELAPGYDFDPRVGSTEVITSREPRGTHGFNPSRRSMRTIMVFNGPAVAAGRKLRDVRIIDFAPTLSKLLDIPRPKDATGNVLEEALSSSP
jgi:predicted AlkP superfamily phosphohydrolase/phosphomutase